MIDEVEVAVNHIQQADAIARTLIVAQDSRAGTVSKGTVCVLMSVITDLLEGSVDALEGIEQPEAVNTL
jgi:hypothetical protein